ncbi:MAG TPA: DUF4348 domain-containing protein, partial [Tenuifilaceae bacterium]|nr:DUF4348 domain-containing protein [Tenuifilaceae bacterium]
LFIVALIGQQACAQPENFDDFLKKFSNDSTFQLSRVQFPLQYEYLNRETFNIDTCNLLLQDYKITRLHNVLLKCSEAYPMIYDNFDCKLRETDERVFRWKGFTGMDERYFFKRISGKWFLIKIENLGT